jgi:hypothetical protein
MIALLSSSVALACGGFFCNAENRVDQSAERIVFSHDAATDTIETHVQITYQGEAEDFAWIVPVPAPPEVFPSSHALFTALERHTTAVWRQKMELADSCQSFGGGGGGLVPRIRSAVRVV